MENSPKTRHFWQFGVKNTLERGKGKK